MKALFLALAFIVGITVIGFVHGQLFPSPPIVADQSRSLKKGDIGAYQVFATIMPKDSLKDSLYVFADWDSLTPVSDDTSKAHTALFVIKKRLITPKKHSLIKGRFHYLGERSFEIPNDSCYIREGVITKIIDANKK